MPIRYLCVAVIVGWWIAASASSTTFQLTMNIPATRPSLAYTEAGYLVTPDGAVVPPQGWVQTEQGYVPYYGDLYGIPYGYGGRIIPAPPIVSAPGYVPLMVRPTSPQPRHFRIHRGQLEVWSDPNIHRLSPQGTQFRTNGQAVYGLPGDGPELYIIVPRY